MASGEELDELKANLIEYNEQLREVEALLLDEPDNEEYQGIHSELSEAIRLTQEVLSEADVNDASSSQPAAAAAAAAPTKKRRSRFAPLAFSTEAGANPALPVDLVTQIAYAKARSALQGQGPPAWAVGAECVARYADEQWQNARIHELTAEGLFLVQFEGAETLESVSPMDCKPRDLANYKGAHGPVRRAVTEEATIAEDIPAWMKVKETDSKKVKEKKWRNIKAYKKKLKFQRMDMASKAQADSWKNFMGGKAVKKKSGLASNKKKSMFAVPENPQGKVGVVGSGAGMTNAPHKRTRLDF